MQFNDIIKRVQAKCDDTDETYITSDYVLAFANDVYEWIYNQLKKSGAQFDESVVILPGVDAGKPTLDEFQAPGKPLAGLTRPRMIRWKVPGTDPTYWRRSDGPLDYVPDVANGVPELMGWAWQKYSIKLSNYSTAIDIEVSGDFLFTAITSKESAVEISNNCNRAFACKIASEIGKARGNDKWKVDYGADADEAIDDLALILVKENQGKTRRVGRMSRSAGSSVRITNTR